MVKLSIADIGGKVLHDDTTIQDAQFCLQSWCRIGSHYTTTTSSIRSPIVLVSFDTPLGRRRLTSSTGYCFSSGTPRSGEAAAAAAEADELYWLLLLMQHTPQWGGSGCSIMAAATCRSNMTLWRHSHSSGGSSLNSMHTDWRKLSHLLHTGL
eukprot:1141424-Amphidinium_carterae.1